MFKKLVPVLGALLLAGSLAAPAAFAATATTPTHKAVHHKVAHKKWHKTAMHHKWHKKAVHHKWHKKVAHKAVKKHAKKKA